VKPAPKEEAHRGVANSFLNDTLTHGEIMQPFAYLNPTTAAEACRMLADRAGAARVLAGGTDLIIQMEIGRHQPEALLFLGRMPELREIRFDPRSGLTVGAMATMREIELHPAIQARYPVLARGAAEVGSVQIRNLATLGGNLCNASPSADTSPSLLALDAEVRVLGPEGDRSVPITAFWTGPGRTVLTPGEIVTSVHMPAPDENTRSFYYKLAVRKAMDLAMVGIAVTAVPGRGRFDQARIALGAVAPMALRATEAEASVTGGSLSDETIEQAALRAMEASRPISDQRASAEYRREMVGALTRRALRQLAT
jgi:aerobic carbon-monoxide dehydrogenase medium subunit